MTPGQLLRSLTSLAPDTPWPADPIARLQAIEAHAEGAPGDPAWTAALHAACDEVSARDVPLPSGLRRGDLVRFDAHTATFLASDADGRTWMVRAPRAAASAVHRRALARDRAALARLIDGVHLRDDALVAPADGSPLSEVVPPPIDVPRLLGGAITALARWEAAGMGPPEPAPAELRVVGARLTVVVLTPGRRGDALGEVARALVADGPLGRFLEGLRDLPDGRLAGMPELFARALADDLQDRAVELRRRGLLAGHGRRRLGLLRAVGALDAALPPPEGRGAVGYDLEGRPTVVTCADRILRWGPADAEGEIVWDAAGFRAADARRLLRALAAAPINPALQRETGGSAEYTELIGRWVSAALKLRTVRLLLEKVA